MELKTKALEGEKEAEEEKKQEKRTAVTNRMICSLSLTSSRRNSIPERWRDEDF